MAIDEYDNDFDDEFTYEGGCDELTPEEVARIERGIQEVRMGFTYQMLKTEDGSYVFKCNKCDRTAEIDERPFPHKFNCPMKAYDEK